MNILATDLDRTLLPNGPWPADADAVALFNHLTRAQDELLLVYVTGRSLALTEQAIAEYGIRYPDVLCADVGTTIRRYRDGVWQDDVGWPAAIHRASPRWDAGRLQAALAGIDGLRLQEPEHLNAFKLSYYADHERREPILAAVRDTVQDAYDSVLVYSVDPLNGNGLLDLLPHSATKRSALEYLAREAGVPTQSVVFCGDSGNDILPLTAGFRGVVVKNADEQLKQQLARAGELDTGLQLYFAEGDFQGLNGNYASGVIEGCYHYGLFRDWPDMPGPGGRTPRQSGPARA